jgi:hypothetical protein
LRSIFPRTADITPILVAFAVLPILAGGCKQQQSDADAIRAGITQHLTSLNILNLGAMDM